MGKFVAAAKNKNGAVFFMMVFVFLVVFFFLIAGIEITKLYSVSFTVETNLRRLVNNAVENNIDDAWRADGYNYLNVDEAKAEFVDLFHSYTITTGGTNAYLNPEGIINGNRFSDTGEFLFVINITSLEADRETATMACAGTLYLANSIPGLVGNMMFEIPITIRSTNFRTDSGINGGGGLGGGIGEIVDGILGSGVGDELP